MAWPVPIGHRCRGNWPRSLLSTDLVPAGRATALRWLFLVPLASAGISRWRTAPAVRFLVQLAPIHEGGTMKRNEGLALLTRCEDETGTHWYRGVRFTREECPTCNGTNDAGHLRVPCSRYGRTSKECAPVAWRLAYVLARETDEELTPEQLDYAMSLVVNDHDDDVAYIIRTYGHRQYR